MIYRNKKYTALEILQELDQAEFVLGDASYSPEDVFGIGRVRIGGINMAKADALINVGHCESLEIVVGVESFDVVCEEQDGSEGHISEKAHEANEKRAEAITAQNERLGKVKETMVAMRDGDEAPKGIDSDIVEEAGRQLDHIKVREEPEAKPE